MQEYSLFPLEAGGGYPSQNANGMRKRLPLFLLFLPYCCIAQISFSDGSQWLDFDNLRSGLAIGITDMNADGLDDIVVLDNAQNFYIEYQQADTLAFNGLFVSALNAPSWSLCIADADNNGYPDIFTGGNFNGLKLLMANDDGTDYTTVFPNAPNIFLKGANFADIDNDGDADIFAAHEAGLSVPLNNDGNGQFETDYSLILPTSTTPSDNSGNSGTIWTDFNNDGALDLYISKFKFGVDDPTDGRRLNLLFRNDGQTGFEQIAAQANAQPFGQSWASNFADIDNDGDMDCFVINHDKNNTLYRNNGNETFTDISQLSGVSAGLNDNGLGAQVLFADFDNDGFVDLLYTSLGTEHALLRNQGDGTFEELATVFPGSPKVYSASLGDLNSDGFVDVYAGYGSGFNQIGTEPDRLFLNDGNDNHFLRVGLQGATANPSAIGARLELYGAWGQQIREIRSGESMGIQTSSTAHFGIGQATAIDSLILRWPNGNIDFIENPVIDTTYFITEGDFCLPQVSFNYQSENLTYQFTAAGDAGIDTLIWDFGDGSAPDTIGTGLNATHVFPESGTYTVCLSSQGSCGTAQYCEDISVQCAVPEVAFSAETDGLDVSFTDLSFNTPTAWSWDFGDDSTSTSQNPEHGFAEPGIYFVCLVASNDCGDATVCQFVQVSCSTPEASFNFNTDELSVQFLDFSSAGTNEWDWHFGDGSGSDLQNPEHTYATPGTYEVCLQTDGACGAASKCDTITLDCAPPEAAFAVSQDELTVSFADNSTGQPDQWDWSFGDGNGSSEASPTHTYDSASTYEVCLVASSVCGSDTLCQAFSLSCSPPPASYSAESSSLQANFTNTSAYPADSLLWIVAGQDTLLGGSPTYTFDSSGTYEVCLQGRHPCGTDEFCDSLTVVCLPPEAGFADSTVELQGTFLDTSQFAPTHWAWRVEGALVGTDSLLEYNFPQAGNYELCLAVSNACGADTLCQTIEVQCAPPAAGFGFEAEELTVSFIDSSSALTEEWFWAFGDGSSSFLPAPSHTYGAPGDYTVCLTAANACGDTARTCQMISVNCGPPEADFESSSNLLTATFTDLSGAKAESWQWDFGDGNTSTQQNPAHTYGSQGDYEVCLSVDGPCGSDAVCKTVSILCPPPVADFEAQAEELTVAFSDSSSNNPSQWLWSFGDGSSSDQQNPSHTYDAPGNYTVCLLASSLCGGEQTCQEISVGCPPPQAGFSLETDELQVMLSDTSSPAASQWFWEFGDGNTSTAQNPVHEYSSPGTYNICLTASSACGSSIDCRTVSVDCPAPQADFAVQANELSISLQDLSSPAPTSWLWTFGDGNSSTAPNPEHTYAAPGSYQLCLEASSVCGSATTCQTIELSCPPPQSAFDFSEDGLTVAFEENTQPAATQWNWSFGDGNSSDLPNPEHTYAAPGTYTACLEASSICGSTESCQTVQVSCAAPAPAFEAQADQLQVAFADFSENSPSEWLWDFGDGNTSNEQNPTHTYELPGTYQVCLRASSVCGSNQICQNLNVTCIAPQALFDAEADELSIAFTDQSANSPDSWMWSFGDGGTSSDQDPTYTYATPGNYLVCLTVSSACGSTQRCELIEVRCTPPQAGFRFSASGLTATFADTSTLGPAAWFWTFGDGTSSTMANPAHSYAAPGTYEVCLNVSNICGSTQACDSVTVSCPAPEPMFSVELSGAEASFTDESTGNPTSWFWTFGDGQSAEGQEVQHTYDSNGQYEVCLTAGSICGSATECDSLEVAISSAAAPSRALPLQLFPNPTSGELHLITDGWQAERVQLMNSEGLRLREWEVEGKHWQMDLRGWPSGMYLLRISGPAGTAVRRFLRQ